jgi:RNA polymerase sigma factor (sigma-70 family)
MDDTREGRENNPTEHGGEDREWLAAQFETSRTHLRAVAYRMLGSASEAEDAVQESWLRLNRAGASGVTNLGGWLTTVVSRVCLDLLRARAARREKSMDAETPEPVTPREQGGDPEGEALLAESVGSALLVVLNTLEPAERLAFVLHDLFGVPFDEIAPIVGRTATAARQLASRARRRVRGAAPEREEGENAPASAEDAAHTTPRQREIVNAFLAASRGGDFAALLELLDPDAVYHADAAAVAAGSASEVRGAREVAAQFAGRAKTAQLALVEGAPGLVWAPGGQTRVAFQFTITDGKVTAIEVVAEPERLRQLQIVTLGA